MFDKKKFSKIIKSINDSYTTQYEFADKANVNRTYLSQAINCKLSTPPTPKILKKIADASKGITTYNELMSVCGYLDEDVKVINTYDLTDEESNLLQHILEDYKIRLENGYSSFDIEPYISDLSDEVQSKIRLAFKRNSIFVFSLVNRNQNKTLDVIISEKIFNQNIDKLSAFNLDKENILNIKELLISEENLNYSKSVLINDYVLNNFGKNISLYESILGILEQIEYSKGELKKILLSTKSLNYDKILNLSDFRYIDVDEIKNYVDYIKNRKKQQ